MMKLFDILLNLVFPPSCVYCKEPMAYDTSDALCSVCRSHYESEKGFLCPDCGEKQENCQCIPKSMAKYAKAALHLVEYGKEESAARAMILAAKDSSYEYLYRFLAEQLAAMVKRRLPQYQECLVTFVPRSDKKVAKFGVDQARLASKKMASLLGLEWVRLFQHHKSLEQKALSVKERNQNAKDAYRLYEKAKVSLVGKRIILYDDVVTTGATMAACAALLKKAGAAEVIYLSVGKTYKKIAKKAAALPKSKKRYRTLSKIPF